MKYLCTDNGREREDDDEVVTGGEGNCIYHRKSK